MPPTLTNLIVYAALISAFAFPGFTLAETQTIPLYPNDRPATIPQDKRPIIERDGARVSNIHYPEMDLYLASRDTARPLAVIICPGGGYWIQSATVEGKDIALRLNQFGITAFVLRYRLPPDYRHPVPLQDAQRAIRLVRAQAAQWNLKPDRIGIMGFSAGGHLASTAATHFDDGNPAAPDPIDRVSCRPDFAILAYPVICFSKPYGHTGSRSQLLGDPPDPELVTLLSNELQVTDKTPPTFLFASQDDIVVDPRNSIDFFLACTANKVPAELHLFPHGGHGYGLGDGKSNESQWPLLLDKWLEHQGFYKP